MKRFFLTIFVIVFTFSSLILNVSAENSIPVGKTLTKLENKNSGNNYSLKGKNCTNYKEISANLSEYLDAQTKNNNFHGSVLVQKDKKVLLKEGYGMADYENNIENTENTTFPIGSVTKQFIAMSIMQLVEKGKISVDDNLSDFIPEFPRGNEITIHQMMTHKSGIKSFFQSNPELDEKLILLPYEERTPENIINIIIEEDLISEPGEIFTYNNSAYLILGHIVELVSEMELKDYLDKYIFRPLNMKNTSPAYIDGEKNYNSKGYLGYLENIPDKEIDYDVLSLAFGAGYLSSNVIDMGKWLKALDSNKLVSKKTIDLIFTPYSSIDNISFFNDYDYGYGWFISEDENNVMHGGNTVTFSSEVSKYLDENINIVILTNKAGSGLDIYDIENSIYKICMGEEVELPKPKIPIDLENKILKKYEGNYTNQEIHITINISLENGKLYAAFIPQILQTIELIPESETKFFSKTIMNDFNFEKNDDGSIGSLNLSEYNFKKE